MNMSRSGLFEQGLMTTHRFSRSVEQGPSSSPFMSVGVKNRLFVYIRMAFGRCIAFSRVRLHVHYTFQTYWKHEGKS